MGRGLRTANSLSSDTSCMMKRTYDILVKVVDGKKWHLPDSVLCISCKQFDIMMDYIIFFVFLRMNC